MNDLKGKYKALVIGLSLLAILPLFIAAVNNDHLDTFLEYTYVIPAAAEYYQINIHECIKCQAGGWWFATILIIYLVLVIVISFIAVLIPISVAMRIFAGWPFIFTIKALLLGRYPEKRKV
ncbi:MAG: hypothetical protein AB9Q20_08685 [Candidatus Reddybacter sp.]